MRSFRILSLVAIGATGQAVQADLSTAFSGFETVNEVGVSGLTSSYHADTVNNLSVSGPVTSASLANFGPLRVEYPGIGAVASPGGAEGKFYDQGVLGWRVDGSDLVVQLATGMNPFTGRYNAQHNQYYAQGDMFLSVGDSGGVRQYALLSNWADSDGPLDLGSGYASAMNFHLGSGIDSDTREGDLIRLLADNDVQRSTGSGTYNHGNAPDGLDIRVFARGGTDLGDMDLMHSTTNDAGQDWYIMTWTVPMSFLSADPTFNVAFHAGPTCSNDQIGGGGLVPEPASLGVLALSGLALLRRR